MLELLIGATPLPNNPLIEAVKEPIVIAEEVEAPAVEEIKDPNGCEPAMYWASEAPYYCIPKNVATTARVATNTPTQARGSSQGNSYAYGNCTHYAKQLRPDLPNNLGNANKWYANAKAQGLSVGYTPAVGAVAEATTGYMHVAVVQKIDGDMIYITEKNYKGFNVVSSRWATASDFRYIY